MSKRIISLYLSGSIKKGNEDKEKGYYWTEDDEEQLRAGFRDYDSVRILNPATAKVTRQDYYSNFGCDVFLVSLADYVLADLRERRGIGIGSEMTIAKFYGIPVICLLPRNSHYRRDKLSDVCGENLTDWVHPFAFGLSDVLVESVADAIKWIKTQEKERSVSGRSLPGRRAFQDAINYYLKTRDDI